MSVDTQSRAALRELLELIGEIDQRWISPEWNFHTEEDVVEAHRALMHFLEWGLVGLFERDPFTPSFRRIATPTRSIVGDNPDTIYYDASIRGDLEYYIRGEALGAVYISATIEAGSEGWGNMQNRISNALNDTNLDIDEHGQFELRMGGKPESRNWLALPEDAIAVTIRHYFENETSAANDPSLDPAIHIEVVGGDDESTAPKVSDQCVSDGIRRVAALLHTLTIGRPTMKDGPEVAFVSRVPNQFPRPAFPGEVGLAAPDSAYSMAPFLIGPDEALVVRGHWPNCRYGSICLMNRHIEILDYRNRQVALNRKQAILDDDGGVTIVVSHRDPGVPNWLDTEGRSYGLMQWRYLLPAGEMHTPVAELVPFNKIKQALTGDHGERWRKGSEPFSID
jgi:hypothetical protein